MWGGVGGVGMVWKMGNMCPSKYRKKKKKEMGEKVQRMTVIIVTKKKKKKIYVINTRNKY